MTRGVIANHPWLTIQRPAVCILTVFGAMVGALLVTVPRGDAVDWIRLLVALIGAYGVAMSTQVTNDVVDREIDAVEKPDRPIPAGEISPDRALAVGVAGYAVSVVCGFLVELELGLIYTAIVGVSVHYNYHGKGLPLVGNIEVAACVASIPVFGAASQGRPWDLWFIWAFIFTWETGRELVVTVQDLEADGEQGLRTLPVLWGRQRCVNLVLFLYVASLPLIIYSRGVPGFGLIYMVTSVLVVVSLIGTLWMVKRERYAFDAFELWIRTRGRLCILIYQVCLLVEVFL